LTALKYLNQFEDLKTALPLTHPTVVCVDSPVRCS